MASFICPFCNSSVPDLSDTHRTIKCYFNSCVPHIVVKEPVELSIFNIDMYHCPQCNNVSFIANGKQSLEGINIPLYPNSLAKKFPEFVPKFIREDYEESYSILNLSPKASATLARRCLQSMIRDFWSIKKSRLIDEINELKGKIPNSQWLAIDSLRKIGNIGAHMEKDVNVIVDVEHDEAQKLLKLIELLIDKWYVARHDEEELLSDIISINKDK